MSESMHDLRNLFPDDVATLARLKKGDSHFAVLQARYHELEKEIARIDAGIDPASDDRAEELKRNRVHLLDQIASVIAAARA